MPLLSVDICFYHPAPLTRVKDGGVGRPRAASKRGNSTSTPTLDITVHDSPPSRSLSPETGSETKHGQDSEFLGYLSVLKETPRGISSKANRSLYAKFGYRRTQHAYASSRLIRLASAIVFHREQIEWRWSWRGTPPLDPADEDLFLDAPPITAVLARLDDQGWHRESSFMPATVVRIRHELMESLARILIHFDYQFSVLHLQRIRCKTNSAATADLMATSLQVLSMIMDLTRMYQSHEIQRQFACIVRIPPEALANGVDEGGESLVG
ncbi:uncharacterized protein BP01DRAFT_378423 [Aspergillus saccharolyticus JOP 1030-1]|uniref:Transcription factor domain-containing protein n=1 Tax=Aspergillus saccharolyticus JOP 1030-1 TaxID=1450539 RepID=A0A318ZT42_9EURO|nr:hypothetical protein BP01DRAFT_378423 [Aspergillus saccharolyticus JOP 1030-1]PYH49814.1 hypothetical protein BP01DRAFT_378423 [Aspergillus saccharolyticus JOP 1030-1]